MKIQPDIIILDEIDFISNEKKGSCYETLIIYLKSTYINCNILAFTNLSNCNTLIDWIGNCDYLK